MEQARYLLDTCWTRAVKAREQGVRTDTPGGRPHQSISISLNLVNVVDLIERYNFYIQSIFIRHHSTKT